MTVAFTLGLLSATHCVGMCGGIIGALSLSMPAPVKQQRRRQLAYVLLYNLGRTASYALAGALAGGLGAGLIASLSPNYGHVILAYFSALMLVAIGFYIAGWLPQLSRIEHLGVPLWKRIEPFGRRLLPVRRPSQALIYGVVWGWLPCGMVYTLLLWTTASGSAALGALSMLAFGLGTLPAMLASGFMAQGLVRAARNRHTRRAIGLTLSLAAVATLYVPQFIHNHQQPISQVAGICQ